MAYQAAEHHQFNIYRQNPDNTSQVDLSVLIQKIVVDTIGSMKINRSAPDDNFKPKQSCDTNVQGGLNPNIVLQTPSNSPVNNSPFSLSDISKLMPKFDGENDKQPPEFLEFFESSIDVEIIPFSQMKILLSRAFEKSAKLWWDAFSISFVDYHHFKREFLSHFWYLRKQRRIKDRLENGQYEAGTFVNYFNYWASMTRYLQPNYSPSEFIDLIAPHFPPSVSCVLLGWTNFSDAVSRLRHADEYFKNSNVNNHRFSSDQKRFSEHQHGDSITEFQLKRSFEKKTTFKNVSCVHLEEENSGNELLPHNVD